MVDKPAEQVPTAQGRPGGRGMVARLQSFINFLLASFYELLQVLKKEKKKVSLVPHPDLVMEAGGGLKTFAPLPLLSGILWTPMNACNCCTALTCANLSRELDELN